MKLQNVLSAQRAKSITEMNIPFKAMTEMSLRNTVSRSGTKARETGCTYEFSLLINCLTENSHDERMCPKEATNFSKCYENYIADILKQKEFRRKSMGSTMEGKTFTTNQMNKYLKRFPQQ